MIVKGLEMELICQRPAVQRLKKYIAERFQSNLVVKRLKQRKETNNTNTMTLPERFLKEFWNMRMSVIPITTRALGIEETTETGNQRRKNVHSECTIGNTAICEMYMGRSLHIYIT